MLARKAKPERPHLPEPHPAEEERLPGLRELDEMMSRLMLPIMGDESPPGSLLSACGLSETEKEYVVRAEVPGFELKELDVELRGDRLMMSGKHVEEALSREWHYEVLVPVAVDGAKAKAVCREGVLEVRLPKIAGKEVKGKK
jgi:HSP20 family protein